MSGASSPHESSGRDELITFAHLLTRLTGMCASCADDGSNELGPSWISACTVRHHKCAVLWNWSRMIMSMTCLPQCRRQHQQQRDPLHSETAPLWQPNSQVFMRIPRTSNSATTQRTLTESPKILFLKQNLIVSKNVYLSPTRSHFLIFRKTSGMSSIQLTKFIVTFQSKWAFHQFQLTGSIDCHRSTLFSFWAMMRRHIALKWLLVINLWMIKEMDHWSDNMWLIELAIIAFS